MRVDLLGALEVRNEDGTDIVVTGTKLRALVAVLALQVGRVVPTDQLVESLWGDDPPPGVRNGLQGLTSKLRRALGNSDLIAMRSGGYALELPAEAIDVNRFEHLVADAHAAMAGNDAARAVALMRDAESLWRGNALADFAYEDFALPTISRLSELRLAVVEERLDTELALGRHQGAIVELEQLVHEHPLRERLRGLLMIALYRAGRQADALRVFQEGRQMLGDELGLDPGPDLRRIESAVLTQDPSLDAPPIDRGPSTNAADRHATIPASLSPLIGRDAELRELTRLFADHRLLTLVGPGGVGKTRLAMELARAESVALAYGGCLVELAPVGEPAGVRAAIATALEMSDSNLLAELIGDRAVLILLDNCEHVIATAAEVAEDLLQRCAGLRLVATSREALRVGGETVWTVPPLAADEATELFIERARAAGAQISESSEVLEVVADICARLDGLPLAIELAAARTRAFPVQEIASRLNDRFRLLTGGSRTALPRQQTLRAVVDWSYELLFEDERKVLERMSVFAGGCDLATAEAICTDDTLASVDIDDILHALVDKSLIIAATAGPALRFTQLQTLAEYGREKLAERGDAARIRNAMASRYAQLCAGSLDAFAGDHQREWLAMVADENDNLRAALEWAIDTDDAEIALSIAGALGWPAWLRGTVLEGKRWLDDAFACSGEAHPRTRAVALFSRGFLSFLAGDPERTTADLDEAVALFRELGELRVLAVVLGFYAEVMSSSGSRDAAIQLRRDAVAVHDLLPDDAFNIASREYCCAGIALNQGDVVTGEAHLRQAAAQYSKSENHVLHAICLEVLSGFDVRRSEFARAALELQGAVELNQALSLSGYLGMALARLAIIRGALAEFDSAEAAAVGALELGRRLMDAPLLGMALSSRARLSLRLGRLDDAAAAATEALAIYHSGAQGPNGGRRNLSFDVPAGAALAYAVLGFVAERRGDGVQAMRLHEEGLAQAKLTLDTRALAVAVEGLAGAVAATGDGERAAHLLGHAAQVRATAGIPPGDLEDHELQRVHKLAVALLGHGAFAAAFEQGHGEALAELVSAGPG